MSVLDELGLHDDDVRYGLGVAPRNEPRRCPACGRSTVWAASSCVCGHRLREPSRAARAEAVLGEGVLGELGLTEADLAESLDRPRARERPSGVRDPIVRRLAAWAAELRDPARRGGPLPPERVAEIVAGSRFGRSTVDAALRLVELRADRPGPTADGYGDANDLPPLEEGLSAWLDARTTVSGRSNRGGTE